ncbi:MAG: hypothetical protein KA795_20280, partial [Burkholderiaceae bacterium]|nr:hypothetical protein [Burkholderiaceae bacterium]
MKTFTALIRQAVRAAGRAADEAEQAATTRVIACKGIPIQLMPSLSWPQPQACARLLLSTPLSGLPDATAAMLGRVNA